jgi:hypothetical protein
MLGRNTNNGMTALRWHIYQHVIFKERLLHLRGPIHFGCKHICWQYYISLCQPIQHRPLVRIWSPRGLPCSVIGSVVWNCYKTYRKIWTFSCSPPKVMSLFYVVCVRRSLLHHPHVQLLSTLLCLWHANTFVGNLRPLIPCTVYADVYTSRLHILSFCKALFFWGMSFSGIWFLVRGPVPFLRSPNFIGTRRKVDISW